MTDTRPARQTRVEPDYPDRIAEMKRLRKQHGWSVNSLARRYGVDVETIKQILGEPTNAF